MKSSLLSKEVKKLMKPASVVLLESDTISLALKKLHDQHLDPRIIYFYVVDENGILKGVLSTRKLLLCDVTSNIVDILEVSIVKIQEDNLLQDAMELFARYNLLALPVVDKEGKLLGVVDVDMYVEESFDIADARHRGDIFQLIGLSLEDEKSLSIFKHYRLRMPWIFCSMFGGIMCAIISRFNEEVLSQVLVLAMFIPLVLTLSESVSMQSMTLSLQYIKRPRFSLRASLKHGKKEWQIIGLIALSSGIMVGLVSLLWGGGIRSSYVIGSGIMISVTISAGFGLIFPLLLHKTKLDPKVASGPVVLMLADVLTTAIYLSFASLWLL
jgi:magnesium transporter